MRIRTARQARRIREGIRWGRAISEARESGDIEACQRLVVLATRAARGARSDLMARAIARAGWPFLGRR